MDVGAVSTSNPPVVVRRCGCGCHSEDAPSGPLGFVQAAPSDTMDALRAAFVACGYATSSHPWDWTTLIHGEWVPIGPKQHLGDLTTGDVYLHVLRPAPPKLASAPGVAMPPRKVARAADAVDVTTAVARPSGGAVPSFPVVQVTKLSTGNPNKRRREEVVAASPPPPPPLNAPLFAFAVPSDHRLPLMAEMRALNQVGVVKDMNHLLADASYGDLCAVLASLKPGGLHIATHTQPPAESAGPAFLFRREDGGAPSSAGQAAPDAAGAALGHTPVAYQAVVDLLKPHGVLNGGSLEYVWVNSCYSDNLLDALVNQCGVPFAFGWQSRTFDAGAVAFVKCFYDGLTARRLPYMKAFDHAKEEFTRQGFIIDDPDRYEALCTVHQQPAAACTRSWKCRYVYKHNGRPVPRRARDAHSRPVEYVAPVVHGVPSVRYSREYLREHRFPRVWLPSPGATPSSAPVAAPTPAAGAGSSASGVVGDVAPSCAETATRPSAPCRALPPSAAPSAVGSVAEDPAWYSVELMLEGHVFDQEVVQSAVDWIQDTGLRFDVVDVRPADDLTGESVVVLKVYGTDRLKLDSLAQDMYYNSLHKSRVFVGCRMHHHAHPKPCRFKKASLVHPSAGVSPTSTRFLRLHGHLWDSGFMTRLLLPLFFDDRVAASLRIPASTAQFGQCHAQPSTLVLQVSSGDAAACDRLQRRLSVALTAFNARERLEEPVTISAVRFPVPDAAQHSPRWAHRLVADFTGELISSKFVRRLRDLLAGAGDASAALPDGTVVPAVDSRVLVFECRVEPLSQPSHLSLLISASSAVRLTGVHDAILRLVDDAEDDAMVDYTQRWLGDGNPDAVGTGAGGEDGYISDGEESSSEEESGDDDSGSGTDCFPEEGGAPRPARPCTARGVRLIGHMWQGFASTVLTQLCTDYPRHFRPKSISLAAGGAAAVVVYIYGQDAAEVEHYAELVHVAVESYTSEALHVRAVDLSLLPSACQASRPGCDAHLAQLPYGGGAVLWDPPAPASRAGDPPPADRYAVEARRVACDLAMLAAAGRVAPAVVGVAEVEVYVGEAVVDVASNDEAACRAVRAVLEPVAAAGGLSANCQG